MRAVNFPDWLSKLLDAASLRVSRSSPRGGSALEAPSSGAGESWCRRENPDQGSRRHPTLQMACHTHIQSRNDDSSIKAWEHSRHLQQHKVENKKYRPMTLSSRPCCRPVNCDKRLPRLLGRSNATIAKWAAGRSRSSRSRGSAKGTESRTLGAIDVTTARTACCVREPLGL